jgi:hypothetical protein
MIDGLDCLLGTEERCATFHDAQLISLRIDYESRELVSDWELCIGDPDAADESSREATRRGRLRLTGLSLWGIEPPHELLDGSRPWLASDGPLLDVNTDTARELAKLVPPGASALYLYFSDWNAFAYCCAEEGAFEWTDQRGDR